MAVCFFFFLCVCACVMAQSLPCLHGALLYRASKYTVEHHCCCLFFLCVLFLPALGGGWGRFGLTRALFGLPVFVCLLSPFFWLHGLSREAPLRRQKKRVKKLHAAMAHDETDCDGVFAALGSVWPELAGDSFLVVIIMGLVNVHIMS